MDVIIVVDMQVDLRKGDHIHDLQGVINRINSLTDKVRNTFGQVIWIRHCGGTGEGFQRQTTGWAFLPELNVMADDKVVEKSLNDPFAGTSLQQILNEIKPDRLIIAGWATDFCVDATVRSAVSNNFHVVVVGDGHTLSDRPHLKAPMVITHHNWVWGGLITNSAIQVLSAADCIGMLNQRDPE